MPTTNPPPDPTDDFGAKPPVSPARLARFGDTGEWLDFEPAAAGAPPAVPAKKRPSGERR